MGGDAGGKVASGKVEEGTKEQGNLYHQLMSTADGTKKVDKNCLGIGQVLVPSYHHQND